VDLSWKLEGYFGLPSVIHYLVIDPDKPLLIHHQRGPDANILTRIVSEPTLRLDNLPDGGAIDLDLSEVLSSA
jgi:hypothetical protein